MSRNKTAAYLLTILFEAILRCSTQNVTSSDWDYDVTTQDPIFTDEDVIEIENTTLANIEYTSVNPSPSITSDVPSQLIVILTAIGGVLGLCLIVLITIGCIIGRMKRKRNETKSNDIIHGERVNLEALSNVDVSEHSEVNSSSMLNHNRLFESDGTGPHKKNVKHSEAKPGIDEFQFKNEMFSDIKDSSPQYHGMESKSNGISPTDNDVTYSLVQKMPNNLLKQIPNDDKPTKLDSVTRTDNDMTCSLIQRIPSNTLEQTPNEGKHTKLDAVDEEDEEESSRFVENDCYESCDNDGMVISPIETAISYVYSEATNATNEVIGDALYDEAVPPQHHSEDVDALYSLPKKRIRLD